LRLTVVAYSALLFAFATIPTGAWAHRPVEYAIIVAAFAPVLVLMVAYGYWLATGRLDRDAGEEMDDLS
jgi:hypothetical protein